MVLKFTENWRLAFALVSLQAFAGHCVVRIWWRF